MKNKLTNNLDFKIISLMLAVIFWLVVVSIEDPEGTKDLELNVIKINENLFRDNDKTYEVISGNTINITVRARQSVLKQISAKDFKATADFSNLSFTGAVPIDVTVLRYANQLTITNGTNDVMQVSIQDLASVDKLITTKVTGSVITGKALQNITVEPNMLRIEGPKTTIDRIYSVYAEVNVSGLSENASITVQPALYDSAGNKIDPTDLTFSENNLKVAITLVNTKMVPVVWKIDAAADEGYGIVSSDYSPIEVEIAGTQEVLDSIDEIRLDDYDVSGLKENFEDTADIEHIVKEKGAFLANPDDDRTAKVVVKVDQFEEMSYILSFDSIELKGENKNYKYALADTDTIPYILTGLKADLEMLERAKLKFTMDVTDLEPGVHEAEVVMDTTLNVKLAQPIKVSIKITE